jgi:hypothetical protein
MTVCAAPIKGTHLRLVKEDVCGVPVTGAGAAAFVTKSFIQVAMEPQYEDGEEFFQRTADGSICVNDIDPAYLKRLQLTIDFCSVDPELVSTVFGGRLLSMASGPVTGAGFSMLEGVVTSRFSLEVWQRVAGSGACDPSGLQRYVYNAWPHIGNARLGSYTIQNGVTQLQVIADTFAPSTLWGDGPGTAAWLGAGVQALEHWLWGVTTVAPPTDACGKTAVA